ncbi:GEVED domain-containing protein [Flavobacterium dauae]|uniref:Ig-like domain-containing protein n=1 Tax=Flavobacterium dauae TaxID=1563479 RepID=UPI00272E9DB7|nr:GEVED domain-containing protein [Flavobacterium dauae]WLD23457.1 GEVED domain-containing protein [Flavobacterium dauae]
MEKTTKQSRFKIRWLNTQTLILIFLGLFLPALQVNAQTYCTPTYTSSCGGSGDDLNSVVITGAGTSVISDLNTGCTGGYEDRTTVFTPVDLLPGQSYNIDMNTNYSPGWEYASIWIDFNNDGTFDNTTEKLLTDLVLDSNPSFSTGSITIPLTAIPGIHRMRIRVVYGSSSAGFDACSSYGWGEAHDYNVNILALTPCSGVPTAGTAAVNTRACASEPVNLSLTGYTYGGGITYQWQSSPTGAGTFTNIPGATSVGYSVTNQTVDTDYRCVVTCTNSNNGSNSNVVTATQPAAITANFYENFDSTATGSSSNNTVPTCWTYLKTGSSGSIYGYTSPTAGQTTNGFYAYRSGGQTGDLLLISPTTVNLGAGTKQLRFSARKRYDDSYYSDSLRVYTMDGTTASANRTMVAKLKVDPTAVWQEYVVYFPSNTTDDYFAFSFEQEGKDKYIFIDDVYYEDAPTCKPIDAGSVKIDSITKNSFVVSWEDPFNNGSLEYEVEVRETGNPGDPGATFKGTTAAGVMNITATGLNPETEYTVYVRVKCSATDKSDWKDGGMAKTMCNYPELINVQNKIVCGPQEVELTAIYDAGSVYWYGSDSLNAKLVHTGAIFTTPKITTDTSYWVRGGDITEGGSVQIGNGNETDASNWNFLYTGNNASKHQYIYTADELKDLGLMAGPITALEFDVVDTGASASRIDFRVALGATSQTTGTTTLIANSNLTEVYKNASQSISKGIMTITFTTPYVWDGVSNIVVQVFSNNGTSYYPYGALRGHSTPDVKTSYLYTYSSVTTAFLLGLNTSTSSNPWVYASTSDKRPNTVFIGTVGCASEMVEVKIDVEPKPAFELSTDMVTSCAGGNSEVVTITTNLGGYDTFVWTPSTGVSGDEVNGWTFNTTQEQEYVLSASQSNGICEHLKTVRVFASEIPQADATLASSYDLCKNEVAELKVLEAIPADATIGMPTTTTSATSEMSAYVYSEVYSKQQYIYSAAELIAQGVTVAGYIDELSFETINSGASLTSTEYTVKMMLTPNTTFGTTNFETGNFVTVFSRTNHPHTFQGLQTMTLDSPFYWDGQSNILIEITQEGGATTGTNNAQTYYNTVAGNNVGIYTTSETDPDPLTGTVTNDRLNVKFGLTQAKVTWSPATNLYLDAATTVQYISGTDAATVYVISSGTMNQIYNATITAPTGCEAAIPVTINVTDVATPVVQNQTFCQTTPVSNIVVTGGTGSTTYNFYDSATATTPVTTVSKTGTYYVEAVQGDCKSTRVAFAVTITTLTMPNAQSTQYSCSSGTVADLVATGTSGAQINWYDSATSTTPLSLTTPLVNNTTYYASQTLGNCESGRIAVLVSVGQGPASLTPQTISVCGALNYGNANLNQIAGSELVWYPSSTSQTPIPNTSSVVTGTYYVSQKINGCESQRAQIIVTAQGSVPAPTATIQNICGSGTVAQLTAQILPNATAEWYSNATSTTPLALTTPLTSGTYYLSQRVSNCISVKVPVAVRITSTSAPAVTPIVLCDGAKVGDIDLPMPSGVSYSWYLNSTSTTALPVTDILKSGYYFVTRVENGCESARTQVQITINSRPNSPTGASPQIFTNYAEISNLVMNEPNVVWYATYEDAMNGNNPLQQNMPMINGSTYYAVVIGTNGCPSLPTPVEVEIVLGVNDFDLSKLNYYPNPTSDLLTINYSETITKVEVFDLNGRLVMTRDFESETVRLDFGTLSSGTYMLNVKTKDSSQFIKIVRK